MASFQKTTLLLGIIFFIVSVINFFTASSFDPSFIRSEVIACMSAIIIILISLINLNPNTKNSDKINLNGKQCFYIKESLNKDLNKELAWGSHLILTATGACSILIYWDSNILLQRGLCNNKEFYPGDICKKVMKTNKMISLVNTTLFPGSKEFDNIVSDLPSVLVLPIESKGIIIIGGSSIRCFTNSDEKWFTGWTEKVRSYLINI